MKIKHTIEISAMDLALILKEKLSIAGVHHSDLDLSVVGTDPGNFSSAQRPLETLKITWTDGETGEAWGR